MQSRIRIIATSVVVSCGVVLAPGVQAKELKGKAPIILTLMTHTDGFYRDTNAFDEEKKKLELGMELYGGDVKMNLESSLEFAVADTGGFLKSVVADGHGVGTHCNNVRFRTESTAAVQAAIVLTRDEVNARLLTDSVFNVSISGICSKADWVAAAANAGYKIADGTVALCYLSMPTAARPGGLNNALIEATYYHEAAPFGFHNRISPIRLQNAQDFIADSAGLVLSNGTLGELASLAEGRMVCQPSSACVLDAEDFEVVYAAIETVDALKGPREVGRINIHVPTSLMIESNRELLNGFLNRLREYAGANTIAFGTELDVLETFEEWEP